MNTRLTIAASLLAAVSLAAPAADVNFTYNTAGATPNVYGFEKKETYDVAIRIDDPKLIGAKVTGLYVPIPVKGSAISNAKGWISTELKLVDGVNAPDEVSVDGTVNNEMLRISFDGTYTLTADGVWVGYSFTINSLDEKYHLPGMPIACIPSRTNLDNGLWVHASRSRLKWTNLGETVGAVSALTVQLTTDFGEYDATITLPAQSYMRTGDKAAIPFTVTNRGAHPLSELTYSYKIGETTGTGSATLTSPIAASGGSGAATFTLGPVASQGAYPLEVTIETCNGQPNTDAMRTASATMNVWDFIPVTRPLVEEFTGLRCGYCPRGYVAMEEMSARHKDMFVGMAYHTETYETGDMTVMPNDNFPIKVGGYPYADFNRNVTMDPYLLPSRWQEFADIVAPADVEVTLQRDPADEDAAKATARVHFAPAVPEADYRIAIGITADGLRNDAWEQSNNYSGKTQGDGVDSPLWDLFLKGGKKVAGLTFNDVVVYFPEVKGAEGSVPSAIEAGQTVEHSMSFRISDIKNILGEKFINREATLRAVAILLDAKTGDALNCNKSASISYDLAGVETAAADEAPVATEWYTLQGVRVESAPAGAAIRIDTYADGRRRATRVLTR